MCFPSLPTPAGVTVFSVSPTIFWPYFLGAAILVIGLIAVLRIRPWQAPGVEKAVVFGPLFFAVPMAVFAGDHFAFPAQIANIVPSWMPWHLVWVYFVGIDLLAASLSLAVGKYSRLAALLLGIMLFCFVLMIHIPNLIANPGDRFALAIMLRDLSFSCGALAFALEQSPSIRPARTFRLLSILRCTIALAAIVFGIEHFLHPNFVPVIPLRRQLPAWMPAHLVLSFTTGTILILAGCALIINRKPRLVASWLGIFVFAVVLLVYVPILLAQPSSNDALNYVADTLTYSGVALLLAGALPKEERRQSLTGERATTIAA
jgi:uncharacterized membrane protein